MKRQQIRLFLTDRVRQALITVLHRSTSTDRPQSGRCCTSGTVVYFGTNNAQAAGTTDPTHTTTIRDSEVKLRLLSRLSWSCFQPRIRDELTTHFDISYHHGKDGISNYPLALHTCWPQSFPLSEFDPVINDTFRTEHGTEGLRITDFE